MSERELQHKILIYLNDKFPEREKVYVFTRMFGDEALREIIYLEGHNLISGNYHGRDKFPISVRITSHGIDFLKDDGGLSAILGVQVVKLHPDTIKDLLLTGVQKSNMNDEEKSALKKSIQNAPVKIWETVITEFVKRGLSAAPDAYHWLQTLLP